MATKTISLMEDAYLCLLRLKRTNESFSDVVFRLASKPRITELAGLLTEKEADEMETEVTGLRRRSSARARRMETEFNDL